MILEIDEQTLRKIQAYGEAAYPEEGAGLLMGVQDGEIRRINAVYELKNSREEIARRNRYLLTPQDYAQGEQAAIRLGLDVVGIFHSHPDHPSQPSEFDRDWAMPWFSYIITSVENGQATSTRCWKLVEDRSKFEEDTLRLVNKVISHQ